MNDLICLSKWSREDLHWWLTTLPIFLGGRIPLTDLNPSPGAIRIFTDAAGGSMMDSGRGIGACIFPSTWTQLKHGRGTNEGLLAGDGKSLAHKLSVWELVGPLLAISSAPNLVRNRQAVCFIDNIGSVMWWSKGWSSNCDLGNTVIRALHLVTKALNIDLFIKHIPRCSSKEALVADALSKSNYKVFRTLMREAEQLPRRPPAALIKWVNNPNPDRELGSEILRELSSSTRVLGFSRKRKSRWTN